MNSRRQRLGTRFNAVMAYLYRPFLPQGHFAVHSHCLQWWLPPAIDARNTWA